MEVAMKSVMKDEWDYTDEFKTELDRRYNYFINGGKMVGAEDADKQVADLVKQIKG